jgi:hypothetical protein
MNNKAINDFLITKTFITETVLNSIENSIWKSFRVSIYHTLFNTTTHAVRFNAQRNLTIAALTDRSSRAMWDLYLPHQKMLREIILKQNER